MCAKKTRRASEYHWTESDLELIEFVKKHTLLYDLRINFRQVKRARMKLWCEFAEKTGEKAEIVSARWSEIRHNYTTSKKRKQRNSKYLDGRLSFLDDYIYKKPKLIKERHPEKTTQTPNRVEDLLKTTVVTQDIIEELIKIKSKDEANIVTGFDKSKVNSSIFSTISETIFPDDESKCITNETVDLTDSSQSIQNVNSVYPVGASVPLGTFIENSISKAFQNDVVQEESTIIETETEQNSLNESVPLFDAQGIKISAAISLAEDNDSKINVPLDPNVLGVDQENVTMTGNSQTKQQHSKGDINHLSTTYFFEDMGEYVLNHFPVKQQKQLRFMLWSLLTEEEIELLKEEDKKVDEGED